MSGLSHGQRFAESVVWINQMLGELNFEEEELGYKRATGKHLAEAREQLLAGDSAWTDSLVAGLKQSNQLNWRVKDDLVAVTRQQPKQLGPLLELLWTGTVSKVPFNACVTRLHGLGGAFTTGVATSVASVMLMARGPEDHPSYRPEAVRDFWNIARWPKPAPGSEPFEKYSQFLQSLEAFMVIANANGLMVPDLLTAQGYMWLITTYDPRTVLPAPVLETFRAWRGDPYTNTPAEESTAAQQREALLTNLADRNHYLFTRNELEQFTLRGEPIPLTPARGASIVPPGFDIPVAVMLPDTTTVNQIIRSVSETGITHYEPAGKGKTAKPDEGVLKALEALVPIIVLARISSDQKVDPADVTYQAIFPVYIHRYSRKASTLELDVSQAYAFNTPEQTALPALPLLTVPGSRVYERRWSFGVIKRRLHQPLFSRDVMAAYQERCAVCGLDVPELLEAAHIIPDRDDGDLAWVRNGMALCKNHHAAYDADLLAVSPNFIISVAPPLLAATAAASPALRDTLSSLHGTPLTVVPVTEQQQPDPDRLATRFTDFEQKWSIPATPMEKAGPTTGA